MQCILLYVHVTTWALYLGLFLEKRERRGCGQVGKRGRRGMRREKEGGRGTQCILFFSVCFSTTGCELLKEQIKCEHKKCQKLEDANQNRRYQSSWEEPKLQERQKAKMSGEHVKLHFSRSAPYHLSASKLDLRQNSTVRSLLRLHPFP